MDFNFPEKKALMCRTNCISLMCRLRESLYKQSLFCDSSSSLRNSRDVSDECVACGRSSFPEKV